MISYLVFLTRAVRRHVFLVLVVLLLGVAGAIGYVHVAPVRYTATATLLPRPLLGNPLGPDISESNGTQQTVAMQTEAGLVDTSAVAKLATEALRTPVPRPQDVVNAEVPPNTAIISITYRSDSALHAQQGAQAFAAAFLEYRENVSLAAQQQTLTSLLKQRVIAQQALRRASEAVIPGSDSRTFASQRQLLYSNQLATLQNGINSTQALSTSGGTVVRSAALPSSADGLPRYLIVVAGALLALVLGLVLAGARERRRDLDDPVMEHDVCGLPLLATLVLGGADGRGLIVDHHSADALPEAYRRMRAGIIAVFGELKVLAISCVSPDASSGPIAVNLGICLAQAGFRVTVVATDAGERTSETVLGAKSSPGLADVLLGGADTSKAVQEIHGIKFLSAGRESGEARELYAGPALKAVIGKLSQESDYVIVASAEVSRADADSVALVCDGVLVAVNQGISTHAETAAAIDRYEKLQVVAVGAVSLADDDDKDNVAGSSPFVESDEDPASARPEREPTAASQAGLPHGRLR